MRFRKTLRDVVDIFILAFGNKAARNTVFEREERERMTAALRRYLRR